jgi:hypothetical protein
MDDDRRNVKIDPGLHDELLDLQNARRKTDGRKSTISDLIAELLHQAKPAAASNTAAMPPPPKLPHQEWHDLLHLILTEGTEREQLGIQSNLEAFVGVIRGRKRKLKAAG